MDNNPLSILRAQVEAATPALERLVIHTAMEDAAVATACEGVVRPLIALLRRMVSDEGIEAARDAVLAKVPLGYGMTRDEAETYAVAALNALLSDSQP